MAKLTHDAVVKALVARGVPEHVANGVAMNFQDESGLDTGVQEQSPAFGLGGYGLAQWTGPRRIALQDYAKATKRSVDDPEAQFDFFMQENAGPEAAAWKTVMSAPDAQTAAVNFVKNWERPATKYATARANDYAGRVLHPPNPTVGTSSDGSAGLQPPGLPADPAGAVDAQQGPWDANALMDTGKALTGSGGTVPTVQTPRPTATMTTPTEAMTISPQMQQMSRDQLAMALARLNAGKLFVG